MTRASASAILKVQRVELLQHLGDTRPDLVAFVAQRADFAGGGLRVGQARAQRFDLTLQPRVLFDRACLLAAQPADDADQHFDFLFETIDGFECGDGCCRCSFGRRRGHNDYRWIAPNVSVSARTIVSIAALTSASVSVRSGARNVRRSDKLTLPSGMPFP